MRATRVHKRPQAHLDAPWDIFDDTQYRNRAIVRILSPPKSDNDPAELEIEPGAPLTKDASDFLRERHHNAGTVLTRPAAEALGELTRAPARACSERAAEGGAGVAWAGLG